MYDYVFRNALVADGTLNKPYRADVAVYAGLICLIGKANTLGAKHVIEKENLVLSPGFIDIHSHDDAEILMHPAMEDKIGQGITTDINGNCGVGLFPLLEETREDLVTLVEDILGIYDGPWDWKDYKGYASRLSGTGVGINVSFLTSHSALRIFALKNDVRRKATDKEIDLMCTLLDSQLKDGSIGFSTGLYYSPCLFAEEKELLALLEVVKDNDKLFAVHHRCEGDDIIPSVDEVLSLARKSGVRLEISHLKAIGKRNQGKVDEVLSMIENARKNGVDVKFDQYPYEYGSTSLFSLLPPDIQKLTRLEQRLAVSLENEREEIKEEMLNPSGWDSIYSLVGPENIRMLLLDSNKELEGKTLSEIAGERGEDPLDVLLDILSEETGKAVMMDITETEDNLLKILRHPLMGFGTDSLFSSEPAHPRTKDAAMHLFREYVSRKHVLSIEEAVRKMSGENADRLRLSSRGYIKEGMKADLVLFDPVLGKVDTVLVNGKLSMQDGMVLDNLNGEII